jgi:hypothetical protein
MKHNVTLRKKEKAFIITCLVLLFLLTLYLISDFTLKSLVRAEGRPVIGKAIFITNDVRRKPTAGETWEPLKQGGELFDDDTVESGTNSTASILLDDSTMIDLCADSLITFDRTGDEMRVSLVRGCGDIRRAGDRLDRKKHLVLVEENHRITLDEGDLSIEKGPGKGLELFVHSGAAKLEINGKERTVSAGERAVINDASVSVEKIKLTLQEPGDGTRLYTTGGAVDLNFSWDYSGEVNGDAPYTFEISKNRDFSAIIKRSRLRKAMTGASLPDGSYFWRVSATDQHTKTTDRSVPSRLMILKDDPIVLLSPPDGKILDYASERPFLNFAWEPHRIASSYKLEISESADFSSILKKIDTRVLNLSYQWERDLSLGVHTYYWRISAGRDLADWRGRTSAVRSFSIHKIRNINPPQLVSPGDYKKICRPCADRENVIFSWERTEDSLKKKIYFSNDEKFGTIYREVPVDRNYWTMVKAFPAGTYYWRVGLTDGTTGRIVYTGERSFAMQDYEDIALISPENEAGFESGDSGGSVSFRWKKPGFEGKYLLELSDNKELAPVAGTIRSSTPAATGKDLSPGRYFWRVKMVDERNTVLAASDARSFTIEEGLSAPVIIAPRSGRGVDMLNEDELKFLWKPSRGASSYILELHQIVRDTTRARDRLVTSTQTREVSYTITDMNLLDVGNFYWTLKAVQKGHGGRVVRTSRKLRNDFKISVSGSGGSKVIVISPKIQVIEDEKRKK